MLGRVEIFDFHERGGDTELWLLCFGLSPLQWHLCKRNPVFSLIQNEVISPGFCLRCACPGKTKTPERDLTQNKAISYLASCKRTAGTSGDVGVVRVHSPAGGRNGHSIGEKPHNLIEIRWKCLCFKDCISISSLCWISSAWFASRSHIWFVLSHCLKSLWEAWFSDAFGVFWEWCCSFLALLEGPSSCLSSFQRAQHHQRERIWIIFCF